MPCRYIYNDVVESAEIDELVESFDVAVKYNVNGFSALCSEKLLELSSEINANNVLSVLRIAKLCKSAELRNVCYALITKEPENVLLSESFISADGETVLKILKMSNLSACPRSALSRVIDWMAHNEVEDRKFLSIVDLSMLKASDFFNVVDEHSNFFSGGEIQAILSHLNNSMRPYRLPEWCTFSNVGERLKFSKSRFEGVELIKKYAVKVATDCSQWFYKYTFDKCYLLHEFELEFLLKILPSFRELKLIMLELAFGSDFVPENNLTIELHTNTNVRKKMQVANYHLVSSLDNYYLLLSSDQIASQTDKSFNLFLRVTAVDLGAWGMHGPISNSTKYRIASACSSSSNIRTEMSGVIPVPNLKPYTEWPLLIDPKNGEKKCLVSAFYFDTEINIRKYLHSFA